MTYGDRPLRMLFVANEHPWPPTHGGRKRMARIVESLASRVDLTVASTSPRAPAVERPAGVAWVELPVVDVPRIEQFTKFREPFVARRLLAGSADRLQRLARDLDPDIIYWSHSYLPAVRPLPFDGLRAKHVVEFPNIERHRFASMAQTGSLGQRGSLRLEAAKAKRWESEVARQADAVVAINAIEAAELSEYNKRVITALNGFDAASYVPSPKEPIVLVVGSWDYRPNTEALDRFIALEWPVVRTAIPNSILRVAGKGSERFSGPIGVEARGFVADLAAEYAESALVLAPAASGGGSQLKVAEALSHGRIVVGPLFLGRELRADLPGGAIVPSARVGASLIERLQGVTDRHQLERSLRKACAAAGWDAVGEQLSAELRNL